MSKNIWNRMPKRFPVTDRELLVVDSFGEYQLAKYNIDGEYWWDCRRDKKIDIICWQDCARYPKHWLYESLDNMFADDDGEEIEGEDEEIGCPFEEEVE